jgi:hypothetical protein
MHSNLEEARMTSTNLSGFERARGRLSDLQRRLADLDRRRELRPAVRAEIRDGYERMIRQYQDEITSLRLRQV